VLSEENQRDIVQFCKQEGLVLLADEVLKLLCEYVVVKSCQILLFTKYAYIDFENRITSSFSLPLCNRSTKKIYMLRARSSILLRKLLGVWAWKRRTLTSFHFSQSQKVRNRCWLLLSASVVRGRWFFYLIIIFP
jgi:hypothetical protein